ncbi:aminotransferase class I/II-fold pyridoxal phosphate-dependent enzyme [Gallaecimonas sp. GXIMD1310]|uniref:aminotransferase class I/II-fold pyridoxal phosphate-dependent enzyme n=1 Tax=Gallaecimonas sp. GXIMD1310 TaxID=3131926 RepID=UPI00324CAABB
MIPYGRQFLDDDDKAAVLAVLEGDVLTQGPLVPQFEQAVARYCGTRHAVAVNSATSALHLACLALGLGPGDRLWTSAISFVASANCGRYCGASVDFVDVEPHTGNLCLQALADKLRQAAQQNTLPKVLVVVHLARQRAVKATKTRAFTACISRLLTLICTIFRSPTNCILRLWASSQGTTPEPSSTIVRPLFTAMSA